MNAQQESAAAWVWDAHSDIPGDLYLRDSPQRLGYHLTRLRRANVGAVIACLWGYADGRLEAGAQQLRQLELLEQGIAAERDAALCRTPAELQAARDRGAIAIILGAEGIEVPPGTIAGLHERGVRHAMLRWNVDNAAVQADHLTRLGKEVLREIEGRHWLIDVSHLPEPAFWELLEETRCPILASHSNASALCAHDRNLTDLQLKALAERGGVVGLNAWPPFLAPRSASREQFLRHLRHVADLIGPDHVAFGFDFVDYLLDRVDFSTRTLARGLAGLEDVQGLMQDLLDMGYSAEQTARFAHGNLLNLWQTVWQDPLVEGGEFLE